MHFQPPRRRYAFSLRSLFVLVTLCAVVGGGVHWLFIRERPYLYVTSNKTNATVYLDGMALGKPPVSLMRRDVEALFPDCTIAPGPLRGTIAEFGCFMYSIEKSDGTTPLLWIDAHDAPEPRIRMPYGRATRVFVGSHPWPSDGCELHVVDWRAVTDVVRGNIAIHQSSPIAPLDLTLQFPSEPPIRYYKEIRSLDHDATARLRLWPKQRATKWSELYLAFTSDKWEKVADGHQVALQIPALPPGEYWLQGRVEAIYGGYSHEDRLVPIWFGITEEGELQIFAQDAEEAKPDSE